jgi:hypothetical protein
MVTGKNMAMRLRYQDNAWTFAGDVIDDEERDAFLSQGGSDCVLRDKSVESPCAGWWTLSTMDAKDMQRAKLRLCKRARGDLMLGQPVDETALVLLDEFMRAK